MDVISELKRMMQAWSISIEDIDPKATEDQMTDLIRKASDTFAHEQKTEDSNKPVAQAIPNSEAAIRTLASVLTSEKNTTYRSLSSSKPGKFYTLEVSGADVFCDCPGFEYRGACQQARKLKGALVTGECLPDRFELVR